MLETKMMDAATYVVVLIAVGVFVAIVIGKYRNAPRPLTLEEKIASQAERINQLTKQLPDIKSFFLEAKRDGASSATWRKDYYPIVFYRIHERVFEKRVLNIPEKNMEEMGWVTNWQKCEKLPPDGVSISEIN